MVTIEVVQEIIRLWNRQKPFREMPGNNISYPEFRSFEGFLEFIRHQTVACFNGQCLYYYEDVMRYLHGQEVVD